MQYKWKVFQRKSKMLIISAFNLNDFSEYSLWHDQIPTHLNLTVAEMPQKVQYHRRVFITPEFIY